MDFEYHYTAEQEAFRKEVREWLDANVDPAKKRPRGEKWDTEEYDWAREFRKKLGDKGWLYPSWSKEYGGGGLPTAFGMIITEELEAREVPLLSPFNFDLSAIYVWGTEEQKQRFLRGRLEGTLISVQHFTEPTSGSDLASLKTRAVQDGDDWVITGEKVFVGGIPDKNESRKPDYAFTLVVTDPEAPRHRNLGFFLVPGDAEGLAYHPQDLLSGRGQTNVFYDEVRVSKDRLIGAAGQGWQVANSALEHEHGGTGELPLKDKFMEAFLNYAQKEGAGEDPHLKHHVVDAYIDSEGARLIGVRNHWMYETHQEMTYHGSQNSLWRKEGNIRIADHVRDAIGLQALLNEADAKVPTKGDLEHHQRSSLVGAHPGGTIEVQKVVMARRMGVSRTKERAAPTPSTVGRSQQSS